MFTFYNNNVCFPNNLFDITHLILRGNLDNIKPIHTLCTLSPFVIIQITFVLI